MIDGVRVEEILRDCLYLDEELPADHATPDDAVIVSGIVNTFGLHPERVEAHRTEIESIIAEWPMEFRSVSRGGGGGWSFLNACMDRDGNQWGEQRNVEQLMCLGVAIGKVTVVPRELWDALPGGMPYFEVDV